MSNIIPFPTHKTQKKDYTQKTTIPFNWELMEGKITFTDFNGKDFTIDFDPWDLDNIVQKDYDYISDLMIDLQIIVDRDPGCHQYVCENLERLIKILKKQ